MLTTRGSNMLGRGQRLEEDVPVVVQVLVEVVADSSGSQGWLTSSSRSRSMLAYDLARLGAALLDEVLRAGADRAADRLGDGCRC
ncbi:hypothetical protein [Streptomyces mirabilis]|uniref:hypothetical protein n=1 Tax=Streptomyces mirabilis TaxID=68239 RepID=UPI0033A7D2C7